MSGMQDHGHGTGHHSRRRRRVDHADGPADTQELTRQLRKAVQRVSELEAEMNVLGQAIGRQEAQEAQPRGDSGAVNRDARWHCEKCGYLLGFYDMARDVLRTRYKEHIVFVRAGPGGFVQIVCRGCSEVNTQYYVDPDAGDAEAEGSNSP